MDMLKKIGNKMEDSNILIDDLKKYLMVLQSFVSISIFYFLLFSFFEPNIIQGKEKRSLFIESGLKEVLNRIFGKKNPEIDVCFCFNIYIQLNQSN
jgi:hypothetical protein